MITAIYHYLYNEIAYAEIEARARRDLGSSDQSMDGNENPQCKGGPNDHWLVQTRSCDVQCTDPWETWCGLSVSRKEFKNLIK